MVYDWAAWPEFVDLTEQTAGRAELARSDVAPQRRELGPSTISTTMLVVVSDEVITEWQIPQVGGGALSVSAVAAAVTFIVGPNGSGKSSLRHWLETQLNPDQAHRVIAHRRLWMEGPGPAVTPAQRVSLRSNIAQWDRMPGSRRLDHANHQRTDAVLFDLMARENARNARAVRAHEAAAPGTPSEEIESSFLDRINTILSAAELPIEISLTEDGTFHAHSFGTGASYPVSEMSDGEKSALLLAAEVLVTAAPIFIIDEPERHLHRSISAGLIAAVLAERTDCHFIVLTHDLDLASAVGGPRQLLLVTGCEWTGKSAAAWDIRPSAHPRKSQTVFDGPFVAARGRSCSSRVKTAASTRRSTAFFSKPGRLCREADARRSKAPSRGCVQLPTFTGWMPAASSTETDVRTTRSPVLRTKASSFSGSTRSSPSTTCRRSSKLWRSIRPRTPN
jgi:ATPase subunit of ABC transporter with duplicated ATPase domains